MLGYRTRGRNLDIVIRERVEQPAISSVPAAFASARAAVEGRLQPGARQLFAGLPCLVLRLGSGHSPARVPSRGKVVGSTDYGEEPFGRDLVPGVPALSSSPLARTGSVASDRLPAALEPAREQRSSLFDLCGCPPCTSVLSRRNADGQRGPRWSAGLT